MNMGFEGRMMYYCVLSMLFFAAVFYAKLCWMERMGLAILLMLAKPDAGVSCLSVLGELNLLPLTNMTSTRQKRTMVIRVFSSGIHDCVPPILPQ